jgi:AcrR family transcriptional regulator
MLVYANVNMTTCPELPKRSYNLGVRAETAAATRQRILDSAVALLRVKLRTDVRLADVAAGAGVSEMTVLRIFGNKLNLMQTALDGVRSEIVAQRTEPDPGDVGASVQALFDHYEHLGDLVIGNLALESSDPAIRQVVRMGREDHRQWVERQFGPLLAGRGKGDRERTVNALIVACDVYTWKRLRRDIGLSRSEATAIVLKLVEGALGADSSESL